MKVTICGGAGEHGRACFLIESNHYRILLDCGMKKGEDRLPKLDRQIIPKIDAVFISHIHEDHSAGIPMLYQYGFTGDVWASRSTIQFLGNKLNPDRYENKHFRSLEDDAAPGNWTELFQGLHILWGRSCHAPGAVWMILRIDGKTIIYTGDYTPFSPLWQHQPMESLIASNILYDLALIEAAHDRGPQSWFKSVRNFINVIKTGLRQKGSLLLPVPQYGRGQDILLILLMFFDNCPILISEEIYQVLEYSLQNPELLSLKGKARIEWIVKQPNLKVFGSQRRLDFKNSGKIILVPGSMLDSDLAKQVFETMSSDWRNTLIFTGQLEPGSFGYSVFNQRDEDRKIQTVHCKLKIHQDIGDVHPLIQKIRPRKTILVHAEQNETERMVRILNEADDCPVYSLKVGESITIGD